VNMTYTYSEHDIYLQWTWHILTVNMAYTYSEHDIYLQWTWHILTVNMTYTYSEHDIYLQWTWHILTVNMTYTYRILTVAQSQKALRPSQTSVTNSIKILSSFHLYIFSFLMSSILILFCLLYISLYLKKQHFNVYHLWKESLNSDGNQFHQN
jgi:hypothetical protein